MPSSELLTAIADPAIRHTGTPTQPIAIPKMDLIQPIMLESQSIFPNNNIGRQTTVPPTHENRVGRDRNPHTVTEIIVHLANPRVVPAGIVLARPDLAIMRHLPPRLLTLRIESDLRHVRNRVRTQPLPNLINPDPITNVPRSFDNWYPMLDKLPLNVQRLVRIPHRRYTIVPIPVPVKKKIEDGTV